MADDVDVEAKMAAATADLLMMDVGDIKTLDLPTITLGAFRDWMGHFEKMGREYAVELAPTGFFNIKRVA